MGGTVIRCTDSPLHESLHEAPNQDWIRGLSPGSR
jgi:hypothetical protein